MTGKQLRNSILQWAIQGKLVPQDPNDEPASVLLERIRAEKSRLVKEKKIKRDKNESIIFRGEDNSYYEKLADGTVRCIDSEISFDIPDNWAWVRLGNIFNIWSARRVHEKDWRSKGIPFYRAREIGKLADYGTVDNDLFIDRELYDEFIKSGIPQIGDLMMTAVGTLGKTYIVDANAPFYYKDGSVLCIGNPYGFYPKYLKAFFESTIFTAQYLSESDGTTVATLTMVRMNKYLIPLPPLKEQERIMKKAAPLLSLADIYATKQNQFEKLNSQIVEMLKKSILQEAIQGRLVPQIASEGTAEELLIEIAEEKKRLVKEGKLKKSALTASRIFRGDDNKYRQNIDGEDVIIDDRLPFEIPDTWRWATLGELILDSTGLSYKKESLVDKCEPMVRVLRGGNIEEGQMLFKADDVMISAKYVPDNLYLKQGTFISPAVSSLEKIGKTALIELDYDNVVVGGFVLLLSPLYSDDNLGKYLYYFFQTGYYHNYCRTITKKSGQAFYNLSRPKLKECYVPIPSKEEIPRILSRIDQALASIMSR